MKVIPVYKMQSCRPTVFNRHARGLEYLSVLIVYVCVMLFVGLMVLHFLNYKIVHKVQ